ncbi:MAG: helix-turn-helix domain-containing protein [Clostridia bacterium]|jgi:carbohydrate diacid regulator|nr:helix-turn-helix domain-containing protein [Clostridia bacterium]
MKDTNSSHQLITKSEKILTQTPVKLIKQYKSLISESALSTLFKNQDMVDTINSFYENDLNISQTSKKCFMHRNTLIYRLNKIENITGLNIKKFEQALILKLIILYSNK